MKFITLILVLLSLNVAFAGLAEDFETLKNQGHDMDPTGAICEQVARLRFAEMYQEPAYTVVTGIQYSDKFNNTIGELDLIVFNNKTQIAEIIAEVKCYTSPKSGLKKAKDQRKRFLENVQSPKALQFKWMQDPNRKLTKAQFNKTNKFFFIAQSGTKDDGYDYELPYSLKELMQLRSDLIDCQARNQCAKPKH